MCDAGGEEPVSQVSGVAGEAGMWHTLSHTVAVAATLPLTS